MNKERFVKTITIAALFIIIMGLSIGFSSFSRTLTFEESEAIINPVENGWKVNEPLLATGMIPVEYDDVNEKWVKADTENDWYDYEEKKWANAVLVNQNSTEGVTGSKSRIEYITAPAGTEVIEEDILVYYVWIPRYAYKITSCFHLSSSQCYSLTGNYAGSIDIKFLIGTSNDTIDATPVEITNYEIGIKDTSMHYFSHPAFWWDNDIDGVREEGEELTGIWLAKFETTGNISVSCSDENCNTANITSKPSTNSIKYLDLKDMYYSTRSMERSGNQYGLISSEVDSHVSKNVEWGAAAYLIQSDYGKNSEVWMNNTETCITGCASDSSIPMNSSLTCEFSYSTTEGKNSSTTGNITGIYDMSGGCFESIMMSLNDFINPSSGLTIFDIDSKYRDDYYFDDDSNYGDAIYETSAGTFNSDAWYQGLTTDLWDDGLFYSRGGYYSTSGPSPFAYNNTYGSALPDTSWRMSLIVGSGI